MPGQRVRMTIEYAGADFVGFQYQDNGRSVQGELERVLGVLDSGRSRVLGAGRTDAGVHAQGQVIAFDYHGCLAETELLRAFNGMLPRDVSVVDAKYVGDDFDPRRQASARSYRYRILNRAARSPLREGDAWHVPTPLQAVLMNDCAGALVGLHDFSAFSSEPGPVIRQVFNCYCHRRGNFIVVDIRASSFARRLVRRITGALVNVGSERWSPEEFVALLNPQLNSSLVPPSAPAHGLSLRSVEYGRRVPHQSLPNQVASTNA